MPHLVATHTTRRVWAAVTTHPQWSVRQLGWSLDLAPTTVRAALERLRQAGYIDYQPRAERARYVIVPFVIIGKDKE